MTWVQTVCKRLSADDMGPNCLQRLSADDMVPNCLQRLSDDMGPNCFQRLSADDMGPNCLQRLSADDMGPNCLQRLSADDMGPNCLQRLSADDVSQEMQVSIFPIPSCIFLVLLFYLYNCITGGESGSADTARDPRGFAVKMYSEDGNWDLVGNNTPIFFIRDPMMVCISPLELIKRKKKNKESKI